MYSLSVCVCVCLRVSVCRPKHKTRLMERSAAARNVCARARDSPAARFGFGFGVARGEVRKGGETVWCARVHSARVSLQLAGRPAARRPAPGSRTRGARAHVSAVKCVVARFGAVWPASAIGFGPDRHGPARPAIRGFGSGRGPA